ncbi:hypothetical protein [Halomonas denitrificans]|nr:hypothetical protein [Halomonas denitrificans]
MRPEPEASARPPSRLPGGLVHAGLWGLVFGLIGSVLALMAVADAPDGAGSGGVLALSLALRFALFGVLSGALFWWITGLLFRRERFVRFGRFPVLLGGAAGTAVFVPLFLQTMNLLSGDGPVAWHLVLDDSVWAFVFGGVAALGSLELARRRVGASGGIAADPPEVE